MKKIVIIVVFLFSSIMASAQKTYTIDGQSIQLKTAAEGQLDLLWTIIDNSYRYFIRTEDNQLLELINTQNTDKAYQQEYKTTLKEHTNDSLDVSKVDMTLPSLARFINQYNASINPNYVPIHSKLDAEFRVGVFGGITNSPFVGNPENEKSIVIAVESELLAGKNKKHSGYLQLRHVAEKDAFKYQTTELSLGYRYRFIKTSAFSIFGDVKFATLNFSKTTIIYEDDDSNINTEHYEDTAFDVPLIIGIGADIKLSNIIYANISYNQLFAIFWKNQGNFSTDITLGLKFKLN